MAPRKVVEVETGRVRTADGDVELRCSALGSCVAVTAYDASAGTGGIAHVMLPGRAYRYGRRSNRYAEPAIRCLLRNLRKRGAGTGGLVVCLVGGGNVLRRKNDTLCRDIVRSVVRVLDGYGVPPVRKAVGGCLRRSVRLHAGNGTVGITTGNGGERVLWPCARNTVLPLPGA